MEFGELRFNHPLAMGAQGSDGTFLIRPHEATVAGHVRCNDCYESPSRL